MESNKRKKKAGHRSWSPQNAPVKGRHQGDIMGTEKRSALMSRIRGKDTGPEKIIGGILQKVGLLFECHSKDLPGRPDIVFREAKIALFIDGDFWHGWRFALWKHKLSQKWQDKISQNRQRDQRNFRKLRRSGWKIIRIWEHQIENNPLKCIDKIISAYDDQKKRYTSINLKI